MSIKDSKVIAQQYLQNKGFSVTSLEFKQNFKNGVMFDFKATELEEGDFGGPYGIFVDSKGNAKIVSV